MKHQIQISFKSFEYNLLQKATNQILNGLPKEFSSPKVFYFPKKSQKLTILRSPHIDKKARDQFELLRYKNLIRFEIESSSPKIFIFLENLKNILFVGVQMKIEISSKTYGPNFS